MCQRNEWTTPCSICLAHFSHDIAVRGFIAVIDLWPTIPIEFIGLVGWRSRSVKIIGFEFTQHSWSMMISRRRMIVINIYWSNPHKRIPATQLPCNDHHPAKNSLIRHKSKRIRRPLIICGCCNRAITSSIRDIFISSCNLASHRSSEEDEDDANYINHIKLQRKRRFSASRAFESSSQNNSPNTDNN